MIEASKVRLLALEFYELDGVHGTMWIAVLVITLISGQNRAGLALRVTTGCLTRPLVKRAYRASLRCGKIYCH